MPSGRLIQHGDAKKKTKLYSSWTHMRGRCHNPNCHNYHRYGGRGIKICDEWHNYSTFKLWALAHGYQEGLQLDRINNDDDYKSENCQWLAKSYNSRKVKKDRAISADKAFIAGFNLGYALRLPKHRGR